ncbi:hypothetical protein OIU78_004736 [Salix suchowensis]|nr:hypothetical protein OIU78_004736 [Salix suchowensis]
MLSLRIGIVQQGRSWIKFAKGYQSGHAEKEEETINTNLSDKKVSDETSTLISTAKFSAAFTLSGGLQG